MCSLCGVLGAAEHWSDTAARPEAFGGRVDMITRTQERRERVGLANRVLHHYGLKLAEWQGQYVLHSATGRSEVVPDVPGMWRAAEKLAGRPCDPLDPALITALQEA